MERSWWAKFAFFLVCATLAVAYVIPTLARLDPKTTSYPIKDKINLGLDLQGGLYMVMGVDFNQIYKEVVDRRGRNLESRLKEKSLAPKTVKLVTDGYPAEDPRLRVTFDPSQHDAVLALVKEEYPNLRLTGDQPGSIELGMAHTFRAEVRERTVNQSIEVIRNRIDEFGVAEPVIASQGIDRVVVELPGVRDVQRAQELIGRTAKLEFKMVDDDAMDPGQVAALVEDIKKQKNISYEEGQGRFSDYVAAINEAAKGKIPEGDEIAFERQGTGENAVYIPYLLKSRTEVTGEDLQDAQVQSDPETMAWEVGFQLNPRGAATFGRLTEQNVGKRMAIVLDNTVYSAPVIQSKIGGGSGRITLGTPSQGSSLLTEAKDLAIVLRAGALPAQLELLEQRVVGPSLGADSIRAGSIAALMGALLVFVFMIIYYRASGIIAVTSLLLNVTVILAILVGLEATLTLPGIAGIALTIGMAVDSNVIIYERIREELKAGKPVHGAVEAGFQKALRAVLDSNITTAAAAGVLLMYGTGPIKGFAVTLLVGIVATLFAAVFFSRLMFDLYLRKLDGRRNAALSI